MSVRLDPVVHNPMRGTLTHFIPRHIIYRRMAKDPREGGSYYFESRYRPIPLREVYHRDLESFIKNRADYAARYEGDAEEDFPLDIMVSSDSYVVIEMAESMKNTFDPDPARKGITLGRYFDDDRQLAEDLYGNLYFVRDDGTILETPEANCRMVCFRARANILPANGVYRQPINFNPTNEAKFVMVDPIDPDIRYPGNGEDVGGG